MPGPQRDARLEKAKRDMYLLQVTMRKMDQAMFTDDLPVLRTAQDTRDFLDEAGDNLYYEFLVFSHLANLKAKLYEIERTEARGVKKGEVTQLLSQLNAYLIIYDEIQKKVFGAEVRFGSRILTKEEHEYWKRKAEQM